MFPLTQFGENTKKPSFSIDSLKVSVRDVEGSRRGGGPPLRPLRSGRRAVWTHPWRPPGMPGASRGQRGPPWAHGGDSDSPRSERGSGPARLVSPATRLHWPSAQRSVGAWATWAQDPVPPQMLPRMRGGVPQGHGGARGGSLRARSGPGGAPEPGSGVPPLTLHVPNRDL